MTTWTSNRSVRESFVCALSGMGALCEAGEVLGLDPEALEISVPAPGTNHSLQLTTDGEITVEFGPWHIHCTPFSDVEDTYNKAVAQAIKMIYEIITEKVVFVHESDPFASHVLPSEIPAFLTPSTIQVYSWLGIYDRLTAHRQI